MLTQIVKPGAYWTQKDIVLATSSCIAKHNDIKGQIADLQRKEDEFIANNLEKLLRGRLQELLAAYPDVGDLLTKDFEYIPISIENQFIKGAIAKYGKDEKHHEGATITFYKHTIPPCYTMEKIAELLTKAAKILAEMLTITFEEKDDSILVRLSW